MRICLLGFLLAVLALSLLPFTIAQSAPQSDKGADSSSAPDLSGVYYVRDFQVSFFAHGGQPPFQPWALDAYKAKLQHEKANEDPTDLDDPTTSRCIPPGMARIMFHPFPFEVIQSQNRVLMLFEFNRQIREIYLDRKEHPANLQPTYMGDSIGHYEGNQLVVDTVGISEKAWLDGAALPHSDALHLIEHIYRADPKTLEDDFTIDDPKAYTQTWTGKKLYGLKPGWEIQEYVCEQNNRFMNTTATPH